MIIGRWHSPAAAEGPARVVPDGCRDLICRTGVDGASHWSISPLFDRAAQVAMQAGHSASGFRLSPDLQLDESRLLSDLAGSPADEATVATAVASSSS